jgi:hypothetical protein
MYGDVIMNGDLVVADFKVLCGILLKEIQRYSVDSDWVR